MTDANAERRKIVESLIMSICSDGNSDPKPMARDILAALDAHDVAQAREKEDRMWALRISPVAPILAPRTAVPAEVTAYMTDMALNEFHKRHESSHDAMQAALRAALAVAPQEPEAPRAAADQTAADRKIAEAARKIADGQCWPVEYRDLCAAIAERFGGGA